MPRILFHYPGVFHAELNSGEKKRPRRMWESFGKLGYQVETIVGTHAERAARVRAVLPHLAEFAFLYAENSTLPFRLTTANHLPRWPSPDLALFRAAAAAGLPAGVYYRDVYWKFASFAQEVGGLKRSLALPFYWEELRVYARTMRRVFVQSPEFGELLGEIPVERLEVLPPGGDWEGEIARPPPPPLRLLYIGSVRPPIYDVRHVFAAMAEVQELPIALDVVTRRDDWQACAHLYPLPANVHVHHVTGDALSPLLLGSHLSVQHFAADPYRRLVLPLKLFEAVSSGLPIVTGLGTATSRFVTEHGIGWTVAQGDLAGLLRSLLVDASPLAARQARLAAIRAEHTWSARCEQVARSLARVR